MISRTGRTSCIINTGRDGSRYVVCPSKLALVISFVSEFVFISAVLQNYPASFNS